MDAHSAQGGSLEWLCKRNSCNVDVMDTVELVYPLLRFSAACELAPSLQRQIGNVDQNSNVLQLTGTVIHNRDRSPAVDARCVGRGPRAGSPSQGRGLCQLSACV